jgi:hypothetical protein
MEQGLQLGVSALVGRVLSRTDLSDVDVQRITSQLQQFTDKATEQAKSLSSKVPIAYLGNPLIQLGQMSKTTCSIPNLGT